MHQPPHPGMPPPHPAPPKSSMKLVVGGFALVVLVVGVGLALFLSSARGRGFADAVVLTYTGKRAPGTKELREIGCKEAMVVKTEDLGNILGPAVAEGRPLAGADTSPRESVTCTADPAGEAPTCDDVARTYVAAVGERSASFLVSVHGAGKRDCTTEHDRSGVLVSRVYDGTDAL